MKLRKVRLFNFRNFKEFNWLPGDGVNILYGCNAQGKTNLLEAIFIAVTGYSFRTNRIKDVINWESENAVIEMEFQIQDTIKYIKIYFTVNGQKLILLNGNEINRDNYPLRPGAVLFQPDDLMLVKGGPSERRHLLDHEIGTLEPTYGYHSQQYQKVLAQRNHLLRLIREKKQNKQSLEIWNSQLCSTGARVILKRLEMLGRFYGPFKVHYSALTGADERMEIRYLASLTLGNAKTLTEIEECFKIELAQKLNNELARSQTLIGPHRDDLLFLLNGKDVRQFGSQGQQRSVVVAVKLTLLELWHRDTGFYPLLLLDDVLTELDAYRQDFLLKSITGGPNTFVTSSKGKQPGFLESQFLLDKGELIKEVP